MIITHLNIGEKPAGYTLDALADDIIHAAPLTQIVQENFGDLWRYIPLCDEINASAAELVTSKILQQCVISPQATFLHILGQNVGADIGDYTMRNIVGGLDNAMEQLETLLTTKLREQTLLSYL